MKNSKEVWERHTDKITKDFKLVEGQSIVRLDKKNCNGQRVYWELTCNLCKEDIYYKTNRSPYITEITTTALKVGRYCRCNSPKRLSDQDRKLKVCLFFEHSFIYNYDCRNIKNIKWSCSHGHKNTTTYNKLLGGSRGDKIYCNTCLKTGKQFTEYKTFKNDHTENYLYLLKFVSNVETFYKIGITVDLNSRLRVMHSQTRYHYEITLVDYRHSDKESIVSQEKYLHQKYSELSYEPTIKFGGYTECFLPESSITL